MLTGVKGQLEKGKESIKSEAQWITESQGPDTNINPPKWNRNPPKYILDFNEEDKADLISDSTLPPLQ